MICNRMLRGDARRGSFQLVAAIVVILFGTNAVHGQDYDKVILLDGLERPTGITLDLYGNLYYTELPTPGVFGDEGGTNRVVRYSLRRGSTRVISEGEPAPTNLAVNAFGTVYWTCRTAGVILSSRRLGTRPPEVVLTELQQPVGLDVPLFSSLLLYTEVPEPGVPNGSNQVVISFPFFGSRLNFPLSVGEPEPVDVALGLDGTVYWTCKTAGVILKRGLNGEVSVVLSELDNPVGLDIDVFGRIYFTEIPTPGISGDNGGENRVSRYNPSNGRLVVISEGEPEPYDVTVNRFGSRVYWTCRTAGVIIVATESY